MGVGALGQLDRLRSLHGEGRPFECVLSERGFWRGRGCLIECSRAA